MSEKQFDFNQNLTNIFLSLKSLNSLKEVSLVSMETDKFIITPYSKHYSRNLSTKSELQKLGLDISEDNENFILFLVFDKDANVEGLIKIQNMLKNKSSVSVTSYEVTTMYENNLNDVILKIYLWLKQRCLAHAVYLDENMFINPNNINNFKLGNIIDGYQEIKLDEPFVRSKKILTAGPLVSNYEKLYVQDAVENGWNENWSKYLDLFQNEFKETIDSSYSLATSSCTGSLYLSLLAAGIGKGDEVIVPEITWVATASAVKYTGAKPIFADVDLDTWTISLESIQKVYTKNTAAIIPVHLYGNASKMTEIMNFAKSKNIKVIEDAAPAIGATYDGKKLGTFGDFGCFSFQGAKLLVTGEGGMVVTNSKKNYEKILKLNDHGRVPGTFWIDEIGYKFKMSNLQAAFGLGQLQNLNQMIDAKTNIYNRYKENLKDIENISFMKETENSKSIFWMTSFSIVDKVNSVKELADYLESNNIDTRPVFPPISQYPIWNTSYIPKKNAKFIGENSINLPSGVMLLEEQIDYISENIINFFNKKKKVN